jgi:hypothetical protein
MKSLLNQFKAYFLNLSLIANPDPEAPTTPIPLTLKAIEGLKKIL